MTTSIFGENCEAIKLDNYNLTQQALESNGRGMFKGTYEISQSKRHLVIFICAPTSSEGGFVTIIRFEGYLIAT
jgi:hypothetical protein